MTTNILESLKSDDFHVRVGFVPPHALRRILLKTPEVINIVRALASRELGEQTIRGFVNTLMCDLTKGQQFEHDLVIAALAVALETQDTEFARQFITTLAQLKAAEMGTSIRVAREIRDYAIEQRPHMRVRQT